MNKESYNILKPLSDLTNLLAEKRSAWSQHILLLASTLFGILIYLQGKSSGTLPTRLCFALAVVALGFGILLTAIALYSHIDAISRTRKDYTEEAISALHEHREMNSVSASVRRLFVFCEWLGYICFFATVLLLSAYSFLLALGG
ncbi:hypothetical protein [Williamwhitmania taraxaci]|uniref:Uncharacterized protein n=1 Tax=Williamwhitmania taraxaci TaxID=1640674 RepID=A0A1G6MEY5_9BACT|nr:hypothetical protein [Williamwhitmania taraxaci]SDC53804.1 hypothetical protein SAMN05216323_103554 [Williamwhitmania taraxaci]